MKEILLRTESIGRNCEFGFVQWHYGINPPASFLRWSASTLDATTRAIAEDFCELGSKGVTGRCSAPDKAPEHHRWWLRDEAYGIEPHTSLPFTLSLEEAGARALAGWQKQAAFLLGRFRAADRLFVFSDKELRDWRDALPLFRAVRGHGPAWLCVVQEGPTGTMLVDDGLIIGRVPWLTHQRAAGAFQAEPWGAMLDEAHAIWRGRVPSTAAA